MMIANSAVWRRHSRRGFFRILAGTALACAAPWPARAITERIYTNAYTGLAINGYDPVAYFVDGEPRRGERENEVAWGGTFWQFANKGNAAAFADAPMVYSPVFGGYDIIGVARGVPQPTDPRIFLIHGNRLHLFSSVENRADFVSDPAGYTALAEARWPAVRDQLAP